ncbi:uncharacterized protein DSM5745_04986 [Aspergillus mulundensis]|uniref:PH domain-containing protein n=1 Tax=Aspergillus mulundensis TaxID=1810919 RepID=A0A3D8S567_9EURO|nr:hypothetical protein DSM5745_04986 [Aspergillus mulundensis]RDW81429.1 hypothetical protein DSM5745_04986 [Aspergillus mulundensis]
MSAFITAYAVGLTNGGLDNGENRYRISASSEEALERWIKNIEKSLIKNVNNRWFIFDFNGFPNIYNSFLDMPKAHAGEIIIEHLHSPLVMGKNPPRV